MPARGLRLPACWATLPISGNQMAEKFGRELRRPYGFRTATAPISGRVLPALPGRQVLTYFDANTYLITTKALDYFDPARKRRQPERRWRARRRVSSSPASPPTGALRRTQLSVYALLHNGRDVCYAEVDCDAGHDSFLLDDAQYHADVAAYLDGIETLTEISAVSISDVIARWIKGERVLDLGCGDGSLLKFLQVEKGIPRLRRRRTIPAMYSFADQEWRQRRCSSTLNRACRASTTIPSTTSSCRCRCRRCDIRCRWCRRCCVSATKRWSPFPNFGHRSHRGGDCPRPHAGIGALPYQWYDSPDVRFFTIADFRRSVPTTASSCLRTVLRRGRAVTDDPSLNADVALYRLGRQP